LPVEITARQKVLAREIRILRLRSSLALGQ